MRQSKQTTIGEPGIFHKMWRGHNREHVLQENIEKEAYLKALSQSYSVT